MARLLLLALAFCVNAAAHESRDMRLVGQHDLGGRGAYQPVIQRQGERWIAYIGHHAPHGTSLLDVTDPRAPRLLTHIPGDPAGGAQMARVCDGLGPHRGKVFLLRTYGDVAHETWDVTRPDRPTRVSVVSSGLSGTHKSWWECDTGIAYLVSGVPGWRTHRMTQVYDLSDPGRPRFIREFGLAGQQPGAKGPVPTGLHGPIAKGNRVYFGYGTNSHGVMQVVDRRKLLEGPAEPTEANLLAPQVGRFDLPPGYGAHTAFPVIGLRPSPRPSPKGEGDLPRDYVVVVNEALTHHCREEHQKVWLVDVTEESKPAVVATWMPEGSNAFCARGRFGAHSSNESFAPVYYRKMVFVAWFNAGVRALDIREPRRPVEVAWFIPAGSPVTNNVEVDERGYVYIVDRAGMGLHILELTGRAREVAGLP